MFETPQTVISVLCEEDRAVLCKISSNGRKNFVETLYSNAEEVTFDPTKQSADIINPIITDSHSLCAVIPNCLRTDLETEKRKVGIGSQPVDCISIADSSSALLVSITNDTAEKILSNTISSFPGIRNIAVNVPNIPFAFGYIRYYKKCLAGQTALVHVTKNNISLLVMKGLVATFTETIQLEKPNEVVQVEKPGEVSQVEKPTEVAQVEQSSEVAQAEKPSEVVQVEQSTEGVVEQAIIDLVKESQEKAGIHSIDLMLLAGECRQLDISKLEAIVDQVEYFSLLQDDIDISHLPISEKVAFKQESYRFVIPVCSALMTMEGLGPNLTGTMSLIPEITLDRYSNTKGSGKGVLSLYFNNVRTKALPFLLAQRQILILGLLLGIMIQGYRFWTDYTGLFELHEAIQKENVRAQSLVEIQERHANFKARRTLLEDRANFVKQISQEQLVASTALNELESLIPKGVNFKELTIDGPHVKILGYAQLKIDAFKFASQLQQSNQFGDVVPQFDDKDGTANFQLTFTFKGQTPPNHISIPMVPSLNMQGVSYEQKK